MTINKIIDVSDLPIEQQKLILKSVVFGASALTALSLVQQVERKNLQEKLAKEVEEKVSELSEEEVRQEVKNFFNANLG